MTMKQTVPPPPPDSQPESWSVGWLSGVSEANHAVTRSALDGQADDRTINRREAAGPRHEETGKR